jgi:endogenous inhibitor of DNA gyrase (YacG/DUF329 family)
MNQKLTYSEPIRFSGQNGQQKTDQQITISCSCGANFPIPLDFVGVSAPCPKCGKSVKISEEEFMPMTCGCGKNLRIPRPTAGAGKKCPSCKKPIKLLIMRPAQTQPAKLSFEVPSIINTEKIEQALEKSDSKSDQAAEKPKNNHLKVRCPCGKKLAVPLAAAHKPIECPQCHTNFRLSRKYFIRISCSCGKEFKILRILEGKSCTCPKCGKQQDAAKVLTLKPTG